MFSEFPKDPLFQIAEALPGVLGNKGNFFQGNKGLKIRRTQAIFGNREHRKSRFCFWGTSENKKGHFSGEEKGNRYPPPTPGRASLLKFKSNDEENPDFVHA